MSTTVSSFKPSRAIRLLLMVLFFVFFGNVASAQTNTWDGSNNNNWNNAANWSLGVPTSAHDVVIPSGYSPVIDINNAVCKSLSINGTLTLGNNNTNRNLTVSGNVTINIGGDFKSGGNGGNVLRIGGNVVNDGTFDMNVGTADTEVTFNGTSSQTINGVGALMDFNSLTLANASTFVINRVITVDRNWTNNGKTVSGTGIVTLTGTCIIGGSSVTAFPNLTVTGTVTQGINTTVSGNFTLTSGTFKLNNGTSFSLTIMGNYLQIGGVFDFNVGTSGTSNMNVAGNFTNSSGISSISTSGSNAPNGTIIFNGTGTQILTIPVSRAVEWVKYIVNTGSAVQLASNLTLSSADAATQPLYTGKLTINGTINLGSYQISQAGGITGAAEVTLNTGATLITANSGGIDGSVLSTNIIRSFSTGANYVFNGTVPQITSAGMPVTVSNLTMSNITGVTLTRATVITNNFSITSGSKTNLGTFSHTAGILTLGGEGTVPGSWGSTTSVAINTNNTYFAATMGIVNNNCVAPIITAQPVALTICENSGGTFTITSLGTAYQWQYSGDNINWTNTNSLVGWSGHSSATLTLTNTPAALNGNYVRCIVRSSGGCRTNSTAVLLTVNKTPSAPTVGIRTQPDCKTATGSVVLNGLPAGNWTINPGGITGNTTSTTISGLAAGTYNYTVTNALGCTSTASANVVTNAFVAVTNTWNGVWSKGTPTNQQKIIFAAEYNKNADITACSCQVNAGVYVDINPGNTLTLTNGLDVAATGNILFKDKSSLVQINDVTNTGNIKYERKVSGTIRPSDYTYWSSPVQGFTLGAIYPDNTSGLFYSYGVSAGVEDWIPELAEKVMENGVGYIVNGAKPQSGPNPPPSTNPFVGVPNNGLIPVPSGFNGSATGTSILLGNPYPSAIDAYDFLVANTGVLDGTLYFWTHNTAIQNASLIGTDQDGKPKAGSGALAYTSDDYASFNLTGGVKTGNWVNGSEQIGNKPNGTIAAGQGFFATSIASGDVKFTNAMRVAGTTLSNKTGVNEQFFKTRNPNGKTTKTIERNRVWLNMTNTEGAFKQTLIGYVTDATNDYDNLFDGESFDGQEFVDFYSINQDKNLVIQGRALPFDENDEVPLGYRTTINGAFTINIDEADGLMTKQVVYLEDKLTNTVFDLKAGNYTFNTEAGTFNDRFVLRYVNTNKTLGNNTFDSLENKVVVSNANKQIKINSFAETIDSVVIYDILGRQIYQKDKVNSNELSISNLLSSHQTVIVKTLLQNGKTFTDKIIF